MVWKSSVTYFAPGQPGMEYDKTFLMSRERVTLIYEVHYHSRVTSSVKKYVLTTAW